MCIRDRCSFSLPGLSLSITTADFDKGVLVCTTAKQRRGDAHGHESPRPPHTALSRQREEISMSRRGRAASEGRGRRCNRATGNRQPPFHAFLHPHMCAFSLISSACFLWQVTALMRRREGQALRRKRPRYTKPATHGRLLASFLVFGLYMHPNRPLDLKIVLNQHPKPPNGITNVFRFRAHSGVVNFLFLFR